MIRLALITLILVYRLIPKRIRRVWSFGTSTSHLGLAAVQSTSTAAEAITVFARFAWLRSDGDGGQLWFSDCSIQHVPNPASYSWRD